MDFMEAIEAYTEKFNEGPPVFGMDEAEAIKLIEKAIDTNTKIEEGAETQAPEGAII